MSSRPDGPRPPKKNDAQGGDKPDQRGGRTPGPFDVTTVKALVGLMTDHDLAEIDLRNGDQRLRLHRGYQGPVTMTAAPAPAAAAPARAAAPAAEAPAAAAAPARKLLEIKSPTVGTFYARPKPDEPPYVKVGSKVDPETVVCQIEAMKLYNEVPAECSGTIAEVLVENGQAVEYDQILFKVDPAG